MNDDKLKELLATKIDSLDRWKEVMRACGWTWNEEYYTLPRHAGGAFHYAGMNYINSLPHTGWEAKWWVARETYRQETGVYPPQTDVMRVVIENCRLQVYCVHVSKDDPTMVAYTPSMEDGMRDKQVRLSFGKLLRKLVPLMTDEHVQKLEASHRSEMDPTFLVARTKADIERAYTRMDGDTGCMRYNSSHLGLPSGVHPSHVYEAPGVGVAYTELDGVIKSRAVIYENPADPKDKRYVRVYGDPALKRKLERAGYMCSTLQGVKLRAIPLPAKDYGGHTYAMPYLDGPGGNQHERTGCYGYILEGEEEFVQVIDSTQASTLSRFGATIAHFKSTSPRYEISTVARSHLVYTCALSGQEYSTFADLPVWIFKDDQVVKACHFAAIEHGYEHRAATLMAGQPTAVRLTIQDHDAKVFSCVRTGDTWIENEANRLHLGYARLSAAKGYTETEWINWRDKKFVSITDADGTRHWVKRADCYVSFDADGERTFVMASEAEAMKKTKKFVSLAPKGAAKAIVHVDCAKTVVTVGGRRCMPGWHDVVEMYDGQWEYSANTVTHSLFSFAIHAPKGTPLLSLRLTEARLAQEMRSHIDDYADSYDDTDRRVEAFDTYIKVLLANNGVNGTAYMAKGGMVMRAAYWNDDTTVEKMRQGVTLIDSLSDDQLGDMLHAAYVPTVRSWAHHARIIFGIRDATVTRWQAEAAGQQALVEEALAELEAETDERAVRAFAAA